jgi:hypothetical protein
MFFKSLLSRSLPEKEEKIRTSRNFIKKYGVFLPIDMEVYLPDDMRLFTVINDIVSTQRFAPTDNGAPGYQKKS